MNAAELTALARTVIDANLYMTLGTADGTGPPWLSPVYYVTEDYRTFWWASKADTRHSRNLAARPELTIAIFDSRVPVYQGRAVYLTAVGEEVTSPDLDAGIEVYNRPAAARGASVVERSDFEPPAAYRLYRARAVEHYTLDPDGSDLRVPFQL